MALVDSKYESRNCVLISEDVSSFPEISGVYEDFDRVEQTAVHLFLTPSCRIEMTNTNGPELQGAADQDANDAHNAQNAIEADSPYVLVFLDVIIRMLKFTGSK